MLDFRKASLKEEVGRESQQDHVRVGSVSSVLTETLSQGKRQVASSPHGLNSWQGEGICTLLPSQPTLEKERAVVGERT